MNKYQNTAFMRIFKKKKIIKYNDRNIFGFINIL